jgi:hypothetical protein
MPASHIRRSSIINFWTELKHKKQRLEEQLSQSYTQQDAKEVRLLLQGEIKALSVVIGELQDKFNLGDDEK